MSKVTEAQVLDAIAVVTAFIPQATAAYTILRGIWSVSNPGKTEADYLNYLTSASQKNITDSAAILQADGYVQQADGSWIKPGPSTPASAGT